MNAIRSAVLVGVESMPVTVEAHALTGEAFPRLDILGLGSDAAMRETRVRVTSALATCGVKMTSRVVVTVKADPPLVAGAGGLDLPIALAVAAAIDPSRRLPEAAIGELSLDGRIEPVRGILAHVASLPGVVLPESSAPEASRVPGVRAMTARTLAAVLQGQAEPLKPRSPFVGRSRVPEDLGDVPQASTRRALEIAAAGGFHVLCIGEPGAGKTMAARRLGSLLPLMTEAQAFEVAQIHSAAGLFSGWRGEGPSCDIDRPFRAPHHTVSDLGLTGGSDTTIRPGEVTLAHHGVLLLDELPEFRRSTMETLARVMRDGGIEIVRKGFRAALPAKFQLIAAMNPCGCGYFGSVDALSAGRCHCSPEARERWRARVVASPIFGTFAMHVHIPRAELGAARGESSASVRSRVAEVRAIQAKRAEVKTSGAARYVLAIARTIADLAGSNIIEATHITEAWTYRTLDRRIA